MLRDSLLQFMASVGLPGEGFLLQRPRSAGRGFPNRSSPPISSDFREIHSFRGQGALIWMRIYSIGS